MSTILDALKKSERARRLGRAPVYRDAAAPPAPAVLRWLSVGAALALILALAVSVWLMTRASSPDLPRPLEPAVTAPPGTPVTAVAEAVPTPPPASAPAEPAASDLARQLPVPKRAAAPVPGPTAARTPPAVVADGEAPWLTSLPASFRKRLPALVVTVHVYTPDETQRILYINNQPYKRGEQIPGGVVVEEILPEGVLLRAHGQRFKLPRPT